MVLNTRIKNLFIGIVLLFLVFLRYLWYGQSITGEVISDNFILYGMCIFNLSLIALLYGYSTSLFRINLLIYIIYNSYFYYGLHCSGRPGGDVLAGFFYALFLNGLHFLGSLIYLIIKFWKK